VVQQMGSTAHTASQHSRSEHAGEAFGRKQLPLSGTPQSVKQRSSAKPAQRPSQTLEQQKGSIMQTASQHAESLQNGCECGSKQDPAHQLPQPTGPQQTARASRAQFASQMTVQQSGEIEQTPAQHDSSSQPAFECSAKQLPMQGQFQPFSGWQRAFAVATQFTSQASMQQTGSTVQTTLQQEGSSHPGEPCET
jgi:hypothetical protein